MYTFERELLEMLVLRQKYLKRILANKQKENQRFNTEVKGHIRVKKRDNRFQYYLRTDAKDFNGIYVKNGDEKIVHSILQKDYNERLIAAAQKELKLIGQYIKYCSPMKISDIFFKLSEGRRRMIDPLDLTDEEYIRQWQNVEYEGKAIPEETAEFYTQKGERVRSKSEVIIADMLNKYHIPYRYEYPINVNGMGKVYPDFTALNVRKRKEVYIEHLGLLDNFDYRENAIKKITRYELDGIIVGEDLILTYETSRSPLNIQLLEKKIRQLL